MKKLILIAIVCSLSTTIYATNDGESRTANVKIDISSSDIINIQAKYTELIIETWDKNEVVIEATVRYDGKMTNKIQEFLEQFEELVNSNISKGGGELLINTDLDMPNRGVKKSFFGMVMEINLGDQDDAKLTYKIKTPGTNKFIISNSYEDVRLIGSFDRMEFTQYSGKLEAGTINSAKMNLKYGSASIKSIKDADMELYEQELDITDLGVLEINAKYSDLDFKNAEKIKAISYESDFDIGSAIEFKGNFKYGEIDISGKVDQSEFIFYEMSLEADEIGTIRLENSKYSKFEFDQVGSIMFDQSYEDETNIRSLGSFISKNSKYGNHSIEVLEGSLLLNAYEDEIEIGRLGENTTEISIDGKYLDVIVGIGNSSFILASNVKYGKVNYDESNVDVKRYIKDSDQLEVEVHSKSKSDNPVRISIKGYEVDVRLD